ncbi:MAG TPA: PA14 domain-containing protein, partial [Verrucomicrobiae bacterium]|nr:PA14 domain-containing protein [Verrucomicrobiae bacterium]
PFGYQWRHDDVDIATATGPTYTISSAQASDAGGYTVVVTNLSGSVTSQVATLTVDLSPKIAVQPASVTVFPGQPASFSVTATGADPLGYQWRLAGAEIAGAVLSNYNIAVTQPSDLGNYDVVITNSSGSLTSSVAVLSFFPAPTITAQPQNQTSPMGNSATFSVTATGTALNYQWQLDGADISGATNSSLTISGLTLAQSGGAYRAIVSNGSGSVTSAVATLTVTPISGISFDFNTPGQFINTPYNVLLNDWLHTALPALLVESPTGGVGNGGTLDVTGTADNSSILAPVGYDFSLNGKTLVASTMIRIAAPTQNNRNTQLGFVTATNVYSGTAPGLTGVGINDNNPQGFMTVILQSTAQPALTYQLRLQHRRTDGGLTEVTPTPTPQATLVSGNWYKLIGTFSNIKDTAANTFTVEASLQDMGANGQTPGAIVMSYTPTNIVNTNLVSQRNMFLAIRTARSDTGADFWDNLHAYTTTGAVSFVAAPASQAVLQGRQATFRALVDGEGPYSYQWFRNGTLIPGAGSWKYVTPPVTSSDNAAQYTVEVSGPGNTVTSGPATLTVQADPLAVVSVGSVDGNLVGLRFNQPVQSAAAQIATNYSINGVAAYSAVLRPDGQTVLLTPATVLAGAFTVTVQNVLDLSGGTVGAANSASGGVAGLVSLDVNNATPPGTSYSFAPGSFEITGGGADIFTAPDSFRYVYTQKTGDFDVKMRVVHQDIVRAPSKAGFEVRTSLDPASPQVLAAVNPKWPARGLYEGTFRQAYNVGGSSWGAGGTAVRYPDGWLRFRRVANTFLRYSSVDGVSWQLDGQVSPTPALPSTVYFGLAVCAGANGTRDTAQFESYADFGGYPGATIAITTQPVSGATVNAGSSTNLSVAATLTGGPASGELSYVWQRGDGLGGWTNVPTAGATNTTFNTGALFITDNGAQFRVIVKAPGAADVISSVTTVVVNDGTAPTLTSASIPSQGTFQILLVFSEPVSAATALNTANYTVTNSAGVSMGISGAAFLSGDPRTVVLTTTSLLVTDSYGVVVNNVQDLNGNTIAANTARTFAQPATPPTQPVVVEFIGNITGSDQAALGTYIASPKFTGRTPDFITYSNVFGHQVSLADSGLNNYGARVFSYFVPPSNGLYRFWMRSDDASQLWMNTNAVNSTDRAGRVQLGSLAAFTGNYTLMATNVPLTGGQAYYLEALLKEGTGGDGISVTFRAQSDTATPPNTEFIGANRLAFPSSEALPTPVVTEIYTGLGGGNQIADQLAAYNNPNVIASLPNFVVYEPSFGTVRDLANSGIDNYLGRMYSYFVAPSNGAYKFYIRSDDSSQLYMNTNAVNSTDPAGKVLLGQLPNFIDLNYRLAAQNVALVGGQRYYLEGLWKEGTGGDGMSVAIRAQSDASTPTGGATAEVAPGSLFEFPTDLARVGPVTLAGITPLNPTASDGQAIAFTAVGISGSTPYTLSWFKNGVPVAGNVARFTTLPLLPGDNGAVFTLVASNLFSRAERSSTVIVNADATAPTIVRAVGGPSYDTVVITFSEPVNLESATGLPNSIYQISGGVAVLEAGADNTRTRVRLRTTLQTPGATYTVTVNGVRDASSSGNLIAANSLVNFTAWTLGGCGLFVEVFTNITGTAIANLQADAKYVNNLPDVTGYVPTFGFGTSGTIVNNFLGAGTWENYGVRVSGLFVAPSNGVYRFYIRSDDASQLFINTNNANSTDPAGKVLVANVPSANLAFTDARTVTAGIPMNGGQAYYIEALMKEGGGGDYIQVTFREQNNTSVPPINTEFASGVFFTTWGNPDTTQLLVTQAPPAELFVAENDQVNLTLVATILPPAVRPGACYQWQRFDTNSSTFLDIADATTPSLSFFAPLSDDGAQYRLQVSIPGTNATFVTVLHVSTNGLPIAVADVLNTTQNLPVTTPAANLLANDSDPNGDPLSIIAVSGAVPVTFNADFNSGVPAGATNYGNATVDSTGGFGNTGALKLTGAVASQSGSFVVNELTPGRRASGFMASFKLRIGDGTAEAADGFSFNFAGDLPNAATGPRAAEDGMGTGFSFCIDNYRFAPPPGGGTANTSGMKIRYGGADVAFVQTPTWNRPAYLLVSIALASDGRLTVTVDGTNVFGNLTLPSYVPATGRFGLYARTGGAFETHWVDDLSITAFAADTARGGAVALGGGSVTYTPATNICGGDTFFYLVNDGHLAGTSIGQVTVNIAESIPRPPVITSCPTNRTYVLTTGNQIALPDLIGELVATDNCCCVTVTQTPPAGTLLNPGTTLVTFTATDAVGLSSECEAAVTVVIQPVISGSGYSGGTFSSSFA